MKGEYHCMGYLIKFSLLTLLLIGCANNQPTNKKEFNPTLSCGHMDKEKYEDYEVSVQSCININYNKFIVMQIHLMKRGRYKDESFTFGLCVNKEGYVESIETKKSSDSPNLETYMHMYLLKMRFPKPIDRTCFILPFEFIEHPPEKNNGHLPT